MPIGTLTTMTQRHEAQLREDAPATEPDRAAADGHGGVVADRAHSAPAFGEHGVRSASATERPARHRAWMARRRAGGRPRERSTAREASVNRPTPARKVRRRPRRCRPAPEQEEAADVRVALMTHDSWSC